MCPQATLTDLVVERAPPRGCSFSLFGRSSCQNPCTERQEQRPVAKGNDRSRKVSRSTARRSGRPTDRSGSSNLPSTSEIASLVGTALSTVPIYGLLVTVSAERDVQLDGTVRTESDVHRAER